jgi:hypothetical protein
MEMCLESRPDERYRALLPIYARILTPSRAALPTNSLLYLGCYLTFCGFNCQKLPTWSTLKILVTDHPEVVKAIIIRSDISIRL